MAPHGKRSQSVEQPISHVCADCPAAFRIGHNEVTLLDSSLISKLKPLLGYLPRVLLVFPSLNRIALDRLV